MPKLPIYSAVTFPAPKYCHLTGTPHTLQSLVPLSQYLCPYKRMFLHVQTAVVTFDLSIEGSQREADQFNLLLLNTSINDQDERGRNPSNEIQKWDRDVNRGKK